jgi:hypothetical protein
MATIGAAVSAPERSVSPASIPNPPEYVGILGSSAISIEKYAIRRVVRSGQGASRAVAESTVTSAAAVASGVGEFGKLIGIVLWVLFRSAGSKDADLQPKCPQAARSIPDYYLSIDGVAVYGNLPEGLVRQYNIARLRIV